MSVSGLARSLIDKLELWKNPCLSGVSVSMFPGTQVPSETLGVLAKLLERTGWVSKEGNQSHVKKLSSF